MDSAVPPRNFFVTQQPWVGFVGRYTLTQIRELIASGGLTLSHYVSEADGRSFAQFANERGDVRWMTIEQALVHYMERDKPNINIPSGSDSDNQGKFILLASSDDPQKSAGLGSLSQAARGNTLANSRSILILVGLLIVGANAFVFLSAEKQAQLAIDLEIKQLGPGMIVDQGEVNEAKVQLVKVVQLVAGVTMALGVVFIVLGVLVYKISVVATVLGPLQRRGVARNQAGGPGGCNAWFGGDHFLGVIGIPASVNGLSKVSCAPPDKRSARTIAPSTNSEKREHSKQITYSMVLPL